MEDKNTIVIEMFYTLICPNCVIMKRMLEDVLPLFGNKFVLKRSLASSPMGMYRTIKLGIYCVPTLLINDKIAFKSVPTKEELINKLNSY